jgi:hypothetical protein
VIQIIVTYHMIVHADGTVWHHRQRVSGAWGQANKGRQLFRRRSHHPTPEFFTDLYPHGPHHTHTPQLPRLKSFTTLLRRYCRLIFIYLLTYLRASCQNSMTSCHDDDSGV